MPAASRTGGRQRAASRRMLSLGLCNGRKRIHAMGRPPAATAGGDAPGPLAHAHWRRCAAVPPLRQLLWRFRSQWRHSARAGRRARFGYDPESYSQNFDDGGAVFVVPSGSPPRLPVV